MGSHHLYSNISSMSAKSNALPVLVSSDKHISLYYCYEQYNTLCFIQLYIGASRATVIQNRDVTKELKEGLLVAVICNNFPRTAKVEAIPENPCSHSSVTVQWLEQRRNSQKPRWLRYFKPSKGKRPLGTITYSDIVLYDFQLTTNGAIKKKSREYLQKYIEDLK